MLAILCVLAAILLGLTAEGMRRLGCGFVLSLLARLLHQGLSVESALSELCMRHKGWGLGVRKLQRLARKLGSGLPLSNSLRACRLVSSQEAAAVGLAQEHGVADRVLDRLAIQTIRQEKRQLRETALIFYPMGILLVVGCTVQFLTSSFLPKLEQMVRETDPSLTAGLPESHAAITHATIAVLGLLLWTVFVVDVLTPRRGIPLFSWLPLLSWLAYAVFSALDVILQISF